MLILDFFLRSNISRIDRCLLNPAHRELGCLLSLAEVKQPCDTLENIRVSCNVSSDHQGAV